MTISLRQQVLQYNLQRKQFFQSEKAGIPVYDSYYFSGKEKLVYGSVSLAIILFFAFFFYRSLLALSGLWPIGLAAYLSFQREQGKKRRRQLELEFKDCILSVAANLRAGYSVENAFVECIRDIRVLYGERSIMLRELYRIRKGFGNNVPLENLLYELGERSGCVNIKEFGEVFFIARKSGGSLPQVIQSTAGLIGEEIALKQEIQVTISGRALEQKIMNIIPFFLVCYIETTNRGFFDVLYHNPTGAAIMTGCLLVYLFAYALSGRICRME